MNIANYLQLISKKKFIFFLSLLSIYIIICLPILQAGYYNDDIRNSLIKGTLALEHVSFWQFLISCAKEWLAAGRFFFFNTLPSVSLFYLTKDPVIYQTIRILFIWLSVFSFAWLVRVISKNNIASLLFLLLVPMSWSIKDSADALTSFGLFIPHLACFMAISLACFIKFQETSNQRWLEISFFLYLLALLTYELGIILLFLLILLELLERPSLKQFWETLKPFLIISMVYIAMNARLHYQAQSVYSGIQVGSLDKIFPTFLAQFSSSFPLSFYIFNSHSLPLFLVLNHFLNNSVHLLLISYLFIAFSICVFLLFSKLQLTNKTTQYFLILGLCLMIMPAALIAISHSYQNTITFGKGYIPVYIQYFGTAFFTLAFLGIMNRFIFNAYLKKFFQIGISISFGLIITLSTVINFKIVHEMNILTQNDSRSLIANALHHQLLADLAIDSIVIEKYSTWNSRDFYMLHSNVRLNSVIALNGIEKPAPAIPVKTFLLDEYHLADSQEGYVLIGEFRNSGFIDNPKIYISSSNQARFEQVVNSLQSKLALSNDEENSLLSYFLTLPNNREFIFDLPKRTYKI